MIYTKTKHLVAEQFVKVLGDLHRHDGTGVMRVAHATQMKAQKTSSTFFGLSHLLGG